MDVEVPLAIGTVRTPPFPVKSRDYYILLRMQGVNLPLHDTMCLLGTATAWSLRSDCNKEPVIEGAWTVWAGTEKEAESSFGGGHGEGEIAEERMLGQFKGQPKRNYTLEVSFTKDGGPLKQ